MCLRMRLAVHSVDLFPFMLDQPRSFRMLTCLYHLAQSSKDLLSPCKGFPMMLLKIILNSLHHCFVNTRISLKHYEWHSCLLPYPLDLQDCYSCDASGLLLDTKTAVHYQDTNTVWRQFFL